MRIIAVGLLAGLGGVIIYWLTGSYWACLAIGMLIGMLV